MRICIPLVEDRGLDSKISEHFGSAPFFLIYEIDSKAVEVIKNSNSHHSHGMCHPLSVLSPYKLDAVVCSGMGGGAIAKLNAAGIKIYTGGGGNAKDVIAAFASNQLSELTPDKACARHGCH